MNLYLDNGNRRDRMLNPEISAEISSLANEVEAGVQGYSDTPEDIVQFVSGEQILEFHAFRDRAGQVVTALFVGEIRDPFQEPTITVEIHTPQA